MCMRERERGEESMNVRVGGEVIYRLWEWLHGASACRILG